MTGTGNTGTTNSVTEIALQYLHDKRGEDGNRVEFKQDNDGPWEILENTAEGFERFKQWCADPASHLKVYVDELPVGKYYGSTVSVMHNDGRRLKWTVWEHPDDYLGDPSERECDGFGLPHGITLAEANSDPWDACFYGTHHESQLCYDVCYALAQILREYWLADFYAKKRQDPKTRKTATDDGKKPGPKFQTGCRVVRGSEKQWGRVQSVSYSHDYEMFRYDVKWDLGPTTSHLESELRYELPPEKYQGMP